MHGGRIQLCSCPCALVAGSRAHTPSGAKRWRKDLGTQRPEPHMCHAAAWLVCRVHARPCITVLRAHACVACCVLHTHPWASKGEMRVHSSSPLPAGKTGRLQQHEACCLGCLLCVPEAASQLLHEGLPQQGGMVKEQSPVSSTHRSS